MDYEKKYKEAQGWIEKIYPTLQHEQQMEAEAFFPELKESEDERIRKELIVWLKNSEGQTLPIDRYNAALAWLEKQGEMDMKSYKAAEDEKREFVGDGFIKCYADFQDFKEGETYWLEYVGNDNYNVRSDNLLGKTYHITPCQLYTIFKKQTWLEKQGEQKVSYTTTVETGNGGINALITKELSTNGCGDEQKPADKVEPKFKVGDWVVQENIGVYKVIEVCESWYEVVDNKDKHYSIGFDKEYMCHLYTIQDAKDGDVLVYNNSSVEIILLFKKWMNGVGDGAYSYAHTFNNEILFNDWSDCGYTAHPATKEQCDLLFQKMKEAGYEWDADKKKLKLLITNGGDFFKTENCEQKPAWSEEDEHTLQGVIDEIQANKNQAPDYDLATYDRFLSWLKSLKTRYTWKPSDEQMEALKHYVDTTMDGDIDLLYQDLKELKGE